MTILPNLSPLIFSVLLIVYSWKFGNQTSVPCVGGSSKAVGKTKNILGFYVTVIPKIILQR